MRGWLILAFACSSCFGQTIASRRYAEKTPLQYNFGPLTAIAPYNNPPNYTLAADAQLQPASTISDNNTFTSTGNFTVLEQDDGTTTFSVASNVGTIVTGSSASKNYTIGSTASSFSIPDIFSEVEITQNGTTSGTDFLALGIANASAATQVTAQVDMVGHTCFIQVVHSGSAFTFGLVSFTAPSAPWYLGFSLMGSQATAYFNTGTGWQRITTGQISADYDPRVSGNLSGFKTGLKIFTSQVTTWKFANLKTSLFGGLGARDIALVTYSDGRPYMRGSTAYFIASLGATSGVNFSDSGNGIFSYDVLSGTLMMLGSIASPRSGSIYEDSAGSIIYDPPTNTERLLIGTWGSTVTVPVTLYSSQSISTDDWLAAGPHISPTQTAMSLPNDSNPYDANMACTQWNYSAGTCSLWLMAYSGPISGTYPHTASSTSDPSVNSWTAVLNDTANNTDEGSRVLRTATTTGSNGVTYSPSWGSKISSEVRLNRTYNQAGTFLGAINAPWPATPFNPPHPQAFSYGNTEYLTTFTGTNYGFLGFSVGNWVIASAPKYGAQLNWPTLVNTGAVFSAASSVTSETVSTGEYASTFTQTVGDLVIVMARGQSNTISSATITDSLSDSFTCGSLSLLSPSGATGFDRACYSFVTHSGTATYTVTLNAASSFLGLTIEQFHPGFLTTQDNAISYSNIVTGSQVNVYTSGAFSTSATGLIVVCADGLFTTGTQIPGTIGSYSASFGSGLTAGGAAACEGTLTPAAQSSITASVGSGNTNVGWWGGAILTFK